METKGELIVFHEASVGFGDEEPRDSEVKKGCS